MLDFIGTIGIGIFFCVWLVALVSAMQISLNARLMVAAVAGIWIALAAFLAAGGEFNDVGKRPVPLIAIFVFTPLILAALAVWLFPSVRRALLSIPLPLMVGLNALRLVGGLFLLLGAAGRLAGPFPYSAGWGDVATAVLAVPVAYLAVRASRERDWMIGAWNWLGALDLFAAIGLATITNPGSPLQLIAAGVGPQAMAFLPWILIPTVLVPWMLIVHGTIYAKLRERAR
jgi:hypothetical protein